MPIYLDKRQRELGKQALLDRIAELEEQLGLKDAVPYGIKLGPQARRLLGVLLKREFLAYESAMSLLNASRLSNNHVSVYVHKIRSWLGPELRHCLRTSWGEGIYIKAADKAKIRKRIEDEQDGQASNANPESQRETKGGRRHDRRGPPQDSGSA